MADLRGKYVDFGYGAAVRATREENAAVDIEKK